MEKFITGDLDFISSHPVVELQNSSFKGIIIENSWNFLENIVSSSFKKDRFNRILKEI